MQARLRQEDDSIMYARRIQLINYGPIGHLDINFPFSGDDMPKPVVLVGENGSGKSVFLSPIANGLVSAKGTAYPDSAEVETGRVYKLRSDRYIKTGHESYFARVDFSDDLYIAELRTLQPKESNQSTPEGVIGTDAVKLWEDIPDGSRENPKTSFTRDPFGGPAEQQKEIDANVTRRCILYFPADRFEDPAWLNADNLTARAEHRERKIVQGTTARRVIASSSLRANQNWLFDAVYDSRVFEAQHQTRLVSVEQDPVPRTTIEELVTYEGAATALFVAAVQITRQVLQQPNLRFSITPRQSRVVGVETNGSLIVQNIFQLSTGEVSLLNMFLSILRDYDLSDAPFSRADDVQGIVVVDEIDLHLHVRHQYEVLPQLIQMFPKVQFIVTTHSPLFVLGMRNAFGDDGFDIYRLPDGHQINAEEFSEFGEAYQAFADTRKHADKLRTAIEQANGPVLCFEGRTDVSYVKRAAELLERTDLLDGIAIQHTDGEGNLWKAWGGLTISLAARISSKVVFVADCDSRHNDASRGMLVWRRIPKIAVNPVKHGIENLFSGETLQKALDDDPSFVKEVITTKDPRAAESIEEEKWILDDAWKSALCNWLCKYGTKDDFQHFKAVFDMLEDVLRQANGGDAPAQG